MAISERSRQKKLARKRAKKVRRKAAQARREQARPAFGDVSRNEVRRAPIHVCMAPSNLFEIGIGHVVVSRKLASGAVFAGLFLVDTGCLGVKNAFASHLDSGQFDQMIERVDGVGGLQMVAVEPGYVRKLVESAVAYARDLGFEPHEDYEDAATVFGDIDATACATDFVFGKDGMPFFMNGPRDSRARVDEILATLTARCGKDGFRFVVGDTVGEDLGDDDLDDGDEDEDEDDDKGDEARET